MRSEYTTRREFLEKAKSAKADIEEKLRTEGKKFAEKPFPEASWRMTMVAECARIGPYSSCYKCPYEYFEMFGQQTNLF